jgi:long-subunit fatty acid transport protein
VHGYTASGTAVLILAVTSNALAQTNDQFYRSWHWSADQAPARVAGLAGAFVAVADDSAAVLFNPAGLVQLQKTELLGGVLARAKGTTASSARDRLRAVTGVGFAGGAGALSPRWRIGGYIVQPQDRRSDMAALRLPDGTVTAGFLDTQVTEVGCSAAWELTSSLSLGARVTATHLKLEGEEQRTGPVELEVGSAAGETRVTGSFGGLLTLGSRLRIGVSGQPGAAYRVRRTANRAGQPLDPGSEYDLRQPGLLALGAAYNVSRKVLVIAQVDYVRYSEIHTGLVVRSGSSAPSDYDLGDALEPRVGIEISLPLRAVSVQLRAGTHSQAPGFLAYRGTSPVEALTFTGGSRHLISAVGASLVSRAGLRFDLAAHLGAEQDAILANVGLRF